MQKSVFKGFNNIEDPSAVIPTMINEHTLQLASSKRDEKLVQTIVNQDDSVINAQGGFYGNALVAASYEGHEKVVEILLAAGADMDGQGHFGDSIQAAAATGFGP